MQTLLVREDKGVLFVTLDRPDVRNAMSQLMVSELRHVFREVAALTSIRTVVLRGAGEHFCSGGDIADMADARARLGGQNDPFHELSRAFGLLLSEVRTTPAVVVCALEGSVMGGGLGLACVCDVALARRDARFGLPETSLGVIPAQIAPFLVERIGQSYTRYLTLTGRRFGGEEAYRMGLVHALADGSRELDALLNGTLEQIRRCAPNANRVTKDLILGVGQMSGEDMLAHAAHRFAAACVSDEALEGGVAFLQKRAPSWAE